MEKIKIPKATAKRLPLYYRYLIILNEEGKDKVSSTELSEAVQVDSASIRRDFSYFGALGKRGYGYDVKNLLSFFKKILKLILLNFGVELVRCYQVYCLTLLV